MGIKIKGNSIKISATISVFYPFIFRPRSIETAVQEEFIYEVENEIKKIITWITIELDNNLD